MLLLLPQTNDGIAKGRAEILKDGYPVSLGARKNIHIKENESKLCGDEFCSWLKKAIVK